MTVPEPNYPPLSTREIQALPEGARVIVTWSEGNDGPNEYRVHWRRGEPYAQTDEDHRQGAWTSRSGSRTTSGRGAHLLESGLSTLGLPDDSGIKGSA